MARYHYRDGVTLEKRRGRTLLLILISIIVFVAAAYVAATYLAPQMVTIPFTSMNPDAVGQKIQNSKAGQYGDRLYLPQINIDIPVAIGGGKDGLEAGAWQRNESLGKPGASGNVALSAYRFTWDVTPVWSKQKSPFYNLGKVNEGDDITLDYKGTRYVYRIDKKFAVTAGQNVEQGSDDSRLTLYAVDGGGVTSQGVALSGKQISPVRAATSSE